MYQIQCIEVIRLSEEELQEIKEETRKVNHPKSNSQEYTLGLKEIVIPDSLLDRASEY